MPKKGFYVRQKVIVIKVNGDTLPPQDCEIIYTTGVKGGTGHKYCRQINDSEPSILELPFEKFNTLQWNCVPKDKKLKEIYHYAPTLKKARELLRTLPYMNFP